jgi:hypothetical protein
MPWATSEHEDFPPQETPMSKETHIQRSLFNPWLAWEQLPEPVREQALDVLTALYLQIADVALIGEQTAHDSCAAQSAQPQSSVHKHGVRIR